MSKGEPTEVTFSVRCVGGDEIELLELGGDHATLVVGITKGITRELVLGYEFLR